MCFAASTPPQKKLAECEYLAIVVVVDTPQNISQKERQIMTTTINLSHHHITLMTEEGVSKFRVNDVLKNDGGWKHLVADLTDDTRELSDDRLDAAIDALVNLRTRTRNEIADTADASEGQQLHWNKVLATLDWTIELVVAKREAQNTDKILGAAADGFEFEEIVSFGHDRELVAAVIGDDDEGGW